MTVTARETAAHADLRDILDGMLAAAQTCVWEQQNPFSPEPDEGCDADREPGSDYCAGHEPLAA